MKRLSLLLILSGIIFTLNSSVYSQPKFIIHLTGGYGVPLGDFKLDIPDPGNPPITDSNRPDADFYPYYTKQVISFGADGKLAIGKKGNFRVVLGASYNMFSNNKDARFRSSSTDTIGIITSFKPKDGDL